MADVDELAPSSHNVRKDTVIVAKEIASGVKRNVYPIEIPFTERGWMNRRKKGVFLRRAEVVLLQS